MNFFSMFKRGGSAPIARDRLQILLAHERTIAGGSDLVALLREEILAVIKKHVSVDHEKVQVKMERGESVSMLEVDIEIPTPTKAMKRLATKPPESKAAAAKSAAKASASPGPMTKAPGTPTAAAAS